MRLSLCLIALVLAWPATAQISPSGPPQNAPPAEPAQPDAMRSEQQARAKLAASGYPETRDLSIGSDGRWSGTALVNGRERKVSVERDGTVGRAD